MLAVAAEIGMPALEWMFLEEPASTSDVVLGSEAGAGSGTVAGPGAGAGAGAGPGAGAGAGAWPGADAGHRAGAGQDHQG